MRRCHPPGDHRAEGVRPAPSPGAQCSSPVLGEWPSPAPPATQAKGPWSPTGSHGLWSQVPNRSQPRVRHSKDRRRARWDQPTGRSSWVGTACDTLPSGTAGLVPPGKASQESQTPVQGWHRPEPLLIAHCVLLCARHRLPTYDCALCTPEGLISL